MDIADLAAAGADQVVMASNHAIEPGCSSCEDALDGSLPFPKVYPAPDRRLSGKAGGYVPAPPRKSGQPWDGRPAAKRLPGSHAAAWSPEVPSGGISPRTLGALRQSLRVALSFSVATDYHSHIVGGCTRATIRKNLTHPPSEQGVSQVAVTTGDNTLRIRAGILDQVRPARMGSASEAAEAATLSVERELVIVPPGPANVDGSS